jgi:hypothetical protein
MLAVVIKIESNSRISGNTDTFFNNGISDVRILTDAHARHEYRGLHVSAILNKNARREDGTAYTATAPQARTDI